MSGRKLLLDSNVVIYLAKKQLLPEQFIRPEDSIFISDITLMETLGYAFSDTDEQSATENLLALFIRLPIDERVVQEVIDLRRSRKIKLPDAIIAATASTQDCLLVTRNLDDFKSLPDLKVMNPFEV